MLGVHIRAANEQVVTKSSPSKSAILAAVRRKLNTASLRWSVSVYRPSADAALVSEGLSWNRCEAEAFLR